MRTVRVIDAHSDNKRKETYVRQRVGIYARVSTSKKSQLHSMSEQVSGLTRWIHSRAEWDLVDIYLDFDSASGMQMRSQFERMIDDAVNHRIDIIVTKSIQRFGRNTVQNLEAMRTMIRAGVVIYFQIEDLYSDQPDADYFVSLFSCVAEEDNRSRREDIVWGQKSRIADGTSEMYSRPCYGYLKNENGVLTVEQKKAKVVKDIYESYLSGKSISGLSKMLEEEQIPSPTGSKKWPARTIDKLLSNEKYTGDVLLYKTVTVNYPYSYRVDNRDGKYCERFCVTNSVEPIIDKETFQRVQEEKKRRCPFEESSEGKQRKRTKYSSKRQEILSTDYEEIDDMGDKIDY